jgi:hypothetical protein
MKLERTCAQMGTLILRRGLLRIGFEIIILPSKSFWLHKGKVLAPACRRRSGKTNKTEHVEWRGKRKAMFNSIEVEYENLYLNTLHLAQMWEEIDVAQQ